MASPSAHAPAAGSTNFQGVATESSYKIALTVAPAVIGHSAIIVEVTDAKDKPFEPKEVAVELSLPSAGIEPIRRNVPLESPARFVLHCDDIVVPGHWRMKVLLLIDDFTQRDATFEVPVR